MFYMYSQNNSGGWFQQDDDVVHYVIIEADSPSEADDRAESIGIYFDGIDRGLDCECCGDRWSRTWDSDGTEVPSLYGTPIEEESDDMWTKVGEPFAYVYYKDGTKKAYLKA